MVMATSTSKSASTSIPIPVPVAPTVLESNPKFAVLYTHICRHLIDPSDGSRKRAVGNGKASEQLEESRVRWAKDQLLRRALRDTEGSAEEWRTVMPLVAEYVDMGFVAATEEEVEDLLAEDLNTVRKNMDKVGKAVSDQLAEWERVLVAVAEAARLEHARSMSTSLAAIVEEQTGRQRELREKTVPTALYELTNAWTTLARLQSEHMQLLIRDLEVTNHGVVSRYHIARAKFLNTVAQGLQGKCQVMGLEARNELYSEEKRTWLAEKVTESDDESQTLESRIQKLNAVLDEFETAGGDVMRTLGQRYKEIEDELDAVKADVRRLETAKEVKGQPR